MRIFPEGTFCHQKIFIGHAWKVCIEFDRMASSQVRPYATLWNFDFELFIMLPNSWIFTLITIFSISWFLGDFKVILLLEIRVEPQFEPHYMVIHVCIGKTMLHGGALCITHWYHWKSGHVYIHYQITITIILAN